MVRRRRYQKQDVVDALERVRHGELYSEVARKSSFPLRTLFKKAKNQKIGIPTEGLLHDTVFHHAARGPACCSHRNHESHYLGLRRTAEAHEVHPVETTHIFMVLVLPWSPFGARTTHCAEHRESTKRGGKSYIDVLFNTMVKVLIENRIDSLRVLTRKRLLLRRSPRQVPSLPSKSIYTCGRRRSSPNSTCPWWRPLVPLDSLSLPSLSFLVFPCSRQSSQRYQLTARALQVHQRDSAITRS